LTIEELIQRAIKFCAPLRGRTIKAETLRDYRKTFARMWGEPHLNALRPGDAQNTYYHRRAALHSGGVQMLGKLSDTCWSAVERNDRAAVVLWARVLNKALTRIEEAWDRDPPLAEGASPLKSPASRWRKAAGPDAKPRGAGSKKYVLGKLPPEWDARVWDVAQEAWNKPADQQDLDALAVMLSKPVRPEDFVPGDRPHGWSEGVTVVLRSPNCLAITLSPSKNHRGRFGTSTTTLLIDPIVAGGATAYRAERCASSGGRIVVSVPEKNKGRMKLRALGKAALPGCSVAITPYVCRDQVVADLKATLGAGAEVAAACGQGTDRTQSKYGRVEHGRKRRGIIGVECQRAPRTGNVARAYALAAKRKKATPEVKGSGSDT
jgi:hypothetical protein